MKSVKFSLLSNHLAEDMAHSQICQAALQCIFTWKCKQRFYHDSWPSTVLKSDFGFTSSITVVFISVHLCNSVECGNFQSLCFVYNNYRHMYTS